MITERNKSNASQEYLHNTGLILGNVTKMDSER